MKKYHFRRLIQPLALPAAGGIFGLFFCLVAGAVIAGETGEVLGKAGIADGQAREARFALPDMLPVFAHMTFAQKKRVIEQAQKDAEAAARAAGQSDMPAIEAGQAAVRAAQRAFARPSALGGNL